MMVTNRQFEPAIATEFGPVLFARRMRRDSGTPLLMVLLRPVTISNRHFWSLGAGLRLSWTSATMNTLLRALGSRHETDQVLERFTVTRHEAQHTRARSETTFCDAHLTNTQGHSASARVVHEPGTTMTLATHTLRRESIHRQAPPVERVMRRMPKPGAGQAERTAVDTRPFTPAAAHPATSWMERRAGSASLDRVGIERIAEQVMRTIDRRVIAERERRGAL